MPRPAHTLAQPRLPDGPFRISVSKGPTFPARSPLLLFLFLAGGLLLSVTPTGKASSEPEVVCVARRPMQPAYTHDVISGVEALVAGVARSNGPAITEYQWEFGDGTKSQRAAAANPLALEARHVYTGPVGRIFRATLTVWDETGATASDDYYVRIRPDTLRTRARMACDFALWNLHKRAQLVERDGVPVAAWTGAGDYHRVGVTAACLQAFQNLGNFPFDDPNESPYVDDVRRALNELLLDMKAQNISPQNAGDPDTNRNGIGLSCHYEENLQHIFSNQGLAMMALVMSRAPERAAECGGAYTTGRKFVDIVQDMVDFMAFGQTDDNSGEMVARGGWRYDRANSGDADMACTEWPVLGAMMAEKNWGKFGISVPPWVKTELRDNFLAADHDAETGGWRYIPIPTGRVNVGLTGIGIICSAWTGLPPENPMVQSGLGYIAGNWESKGMFGHFSSMFNMYAIASAMKAYACRTIGGHDWYQEYAELLVKSQKPDGSWSSEGYEQSWPLTTAWGVLILLEPQTPPSVIMDRTDEAQQGVITVGYRLFDDNYDECDLVVEFSTDRGQTWKQATQTAGDSLTYVEALPDGLPRSFVWDSWADIGKINLDNVLLRITPYDGEKGEAAEVVIPGVYNDIVPFDRIEVGPSANGRGVAFADFDSDGDLDVFVANFEQENFVLRNDSGTLVHTAEAAGMGGSFPSTCGVWGDFNGDGAIDLYLVLAGKPNKLYAGDGHGLFTEVASSVSADNGGGGACAAWGDYDNDNLLDLYVGNDPVFGSGLNALYHNEGITGFIDLAALLKMNCPYRTRAVAWCDFDRDGKLDLYIANDGFTPTQRTNSLFRNLSSSFLDIAKQAGVSDPRAASAVVWGDFNNDGFPDIYLVNSGADGNALYLNNRDGTFRDATFAAGLQGPADARGAAAADFDNDGDLDIFVSAGGGNCLYVNRGNCTFAEAASLAAMKDTADSRGAAWADVNGDGFLDLYVANNGSKDVLYLNRRSEGNWLRVRCLTDSDGDACDGDYSDDRDAIGAIVEVDLDGDMDFSSRPPDKFQMRCVDGGSGYMSQGELWPQFGLNRSRCADIRVTFPDGSVVYKCSVTANQTVVIRDIAPSDDFYALAFTPATPASGQVGIGYVIFSPDERHCDAKVELSQDGGQTWQEAFMGTGGDGTSQLLSSPLGVFHTYIWNSVADLGYSNREAVRIRITPFDPNTLDTGQAGETSDFAVCNNTAPRVLVETPSGVSTGEIAIHYTIADTQSDKCTIRVEYSTDSEKSWGFAVMGSGGDGTFALSSSPAGIPHTYRWNSLANIGHSVHNNVKIRITPSDSERGTPTATEPFVVDNNFPPSASVQTPASVQRTTALLNYHLLDPEGDLCSIAAFYSLDGGRSWQPASMGPGGDGATGLKSAPPGELHSFAWDSLTDFGQNYSAVVRMMIVPRDAKTGNAGQTGDFVVDNLRPAELGFSPTSFSFSAEQDGQSPSPQTLLIWNKGSHSMEWTASSDAGWLILHPSAGSSSGEKNSVEASVDITGLSAGTYRGNITLSAPGAIGSPAMVPVVLEVSPPPSSLYLAESFLSYTAEEGGSDPAPQYLHIRNSGGGAMPWQAQANQPWTILDPDSGSSSGETDTVKVCVEAEQLSLGSYSGTITVSAPGALNSPRTVSVSLDILPAPWKLTVSPGEVTFATRRGGPNPPEQQVVLKVSGGSGTAWQAQSDAAWLSVEPASGTNSGEDTVIHLAIEKGGLYIGTYKTDVTFVAVGLPAPPVKVSVILQVVPILVPDDFPSIQQAINDAQSLDVVSVRPGLYSENIVMKEGVEVVGSGAAVTTIRPNLPTSAVVFQNIRSGLLERFTVSGGAGDFFGRESRVGGGIYCANSFATVARCSISSNSASWGGGIFVDSDSTLSIVACSISANSAASGGGIFCYANGQSLLERTRLFDNSASYFGAGAFAYSAGLIVLKSCELFRNSAELGGDGICAWTGASLEVTSCTIADNRGHGILADPGSSVSISNTILWSNSTDLDIPAGQGVKYCDIETGDFAGSNGNISKNPSFVASEEGCYDLLPNSPCIDAGLNDVPGLPETDIHGEPRIAAVHAAPVTDIGADEHNPRTIFVLVEPVPQRGSAGELIVSYSLWNAFSLRASVVVELSLGASLWRPAARADGDATVNLSSSPTGSPHHFVWDFVPDLKGEAAKSVRIRIRVRGEDARPGATTAPFSVDSTLSDSDYDGLPDAWEEWVVAADPEDELRSIRDVTPTGDPDGDGSTNFAEYLARTDPLDQHSNFRATCVRAEAGGMVIRWQSVVGRIYEVYRCERLGEEWIPIAPPLEGTGQELSVIDAIATQDVTQRYYVVGVE